MNYRYNQQIKRLNRGLQQPLYLLNKFYTKDEFTENNHMTFHVSGSTQNIYTVMLKDNHITCDCPDMHNAGAHYKTICKHCCFILFKVFRISYADIFNSFKYADNEHLPVIIYDEYIRQIRQTFENMMINRQSSNIVNVQLNNQYNRMRGQGDIKLPSDILNNNTNATSSNNNNDNDPLNIFYYKGNIEEIDVDDCPICFSEYTNKQKIAQCPA